MLIRSPRAKFWVTTPTPAPPTPILNLLRKRTKDGWSDKLVSTEKFIEFVIHHRKSNVNFVYLIIYW